MIYYFFLVKVKVKVRPEVKIRSHLLRSWIEIRGQIAYQSTRELRIITIVPFFGSLSQSDRVMDEKR